MNTDGNEKPSSLLRSYRSFVGGRTHRNPHFKQLHDFLQNDTTSQHACRIVCLEFFSGDGSPTRRSLDLDDLASLLDGEVRRRENLYGRILFIEDMSNNAVEILGSLIKIDPIFFASHIDTFKVDIVKTRLQTAVLPSTKRSQNFINLHFHRVIEFENLLFDQTMFREINIPRMIKVLSQFKGMNLGLVRHCYSILKTEGKDGLWLGKRASSLQRLGAVVTYLELGLVLVDAPIKNSFIRGSRSNQHANTITLQTRLFQGGFMDFLSGPSFSGSIDPKSGPTRASPLETFIFYWTIENPSGFDSRSPTLLSLLYYPLRVVAAEWMIYLELMYHSIKQYEYSPNTILASLGHIRTLTTDIFALQQWARRSIATAHKIHHVIGFLRRCSTDDKDKEASALLIEDYEQIALSVNVYSHRLEAMVSVAISLIQTVDSRRSLTETTNISRLSYLALAFIPLTFVSGLFGMNPSIAPGAKIFGLYFAVSIPLCTLVFLFVNSPIGISEKFDFWRSSVVQKLLV